MGFALFMLLNAVLFIRPAELIPDLADLPIFLVVIVACCVVSFSPMLARLNGRSMAEQPITACTVGMLLAVVLSLLSHFRFGEALTEGFGFAKVVIYYLLFVAVVDSLPRLRVFLLGLVLYIVPVVVLALLQYHGIIELPTIEAMTETQHEEIDEETGGALVLSRLCGTGIFNNPNDLSRILIVGMIVSLYWVGQKGFGPLRLLWLLPFGLFGYALQLTYSRGGFLALLVGLFVVLYVRLGRKAFLLAWAVLPLALVVFGGRQSHISTSEGTGQHRIQIWSEGLRLFRGAPIFGIGTGRYGEEVGLVAHNSFVHCYTELGIFGGTIFVGLFYFALLPLLGPGARALHNVDPELDHVRPYVAGVIASYAFGLLSSTRSYTETTYMVLGIGAAHLRLMGTRLPGSTPRLDAGQTKRLAAFSLVCLAIIYVFVRLNVQHGS